MEVKAKNAPPTHRPPPLPGYSRVKGGDCPKSRLKNKKHAFQAYPEGMNFKKDTFWTGWGEKK